MHADRGTERAALGRVSAGAQGVAIATRRAAPGRHDVGRIPFRCLFEKQFGWKPRKSLKRNGRTAPAARFQQIAELFGDLGVGRHQRGGDHQRRQRILAVRACQRFAAFEECRTAHEMMGEPLCREAAQRIVSRRHGWGYSLDTRISRGKRE
jgi:hypothetical protein